MPKLTPAQEKLGSVRQYLQRQLPELAKAVPKGIDPMRLARVFLNLCQSNPNVLDCTPQSLMLCLMQSAAWGLPLDPILGQAYVVPYGNKATLIIGYRGFMLLARRSGDVLSIQPRVVHEKDQLEYVQGLNEQLIHKPWMGGDDPGPFTATYAVARLRTGDPQWDLMWRREVEAVRQRSRAKDSGPWLTDYEAMCMKTVIRRLCKYLPQSPELSEAIEVDEAADRNEQDLEAMRNALAIDMPMIGERIAAAEIEVEPSALDKLTQRLGPPAPAEPAPAPAEPAPAPPPAPTAPPPASPPPEPPAVKTAEQAARDESRRAQQSRHEVPRAHRGAAVSENRLHLAPPEREPGEEG